MITLDLSILNQKGTPMFNSDTLANRPAAGIVGRIFIATDSPFGLFRDTGSAWDQIAGSGGGGSNTIYTANDTLTSNRTVLDGGFGLSFTSTTYIGTAAIGSGSGKLIVGSSNADNGIQIFGANSPSLRLDNAQSGGTQRFVIGLSTATNNFIQGSTAGQFCISPATSGAVLFGMWQTTNATEVMRITTTNRLLIGTTIDAGAYTAQITGQIRLNSYTSSTSYTGTAVGLLAFDSNGNIITTSTGGASTTIYTGDGTLSANRTLSRNAYQLVIKDGTGTLPTIVGYTSLIIQRNETTASGSAISQIVGDSSFGEFTVGDSATQIKGSLKYTNTTSKWDFITGGNTIASIETTGLTSTYKLNIENYIASGEIGGAGDLRSYQGSGFYTSLKTNTTTNKSGLFRSNTDFFVYYSTSNGYTVLDSTFGGAGIDLNTQGTTRLRLTSSGRLLLGTTIENTFLLDVNGSTRLNGTLRIDGQSSVTAGGSSGNHLIINLDGNTYKIALLNP